MSSSKVNVENVKIAAKAVRSQVLRTVLTVCIIAIGITALVGMLTTIDALEAKIASDFSSMGVNTFSIRTPSNRGRRQAGKEEKVYQNINFREARKFAKEYDYPAAVAVSAQASFNSTIKYESKKSNPNVTVMGGDRNYLKISGFELDGGRNFSKSEDEFGSNVALIGSAVLKKLEIPAAKIVGKEISVGGNRYRVIGALKEKGSSMGFDPDNQVIVPVMNVKLNYVSGNANYRLNVITKTAEELEDASAAAIGTMRVVRGDRAGQDSSFEIRKSGGFASDLIEMLSGVTTGGTAIAIITLLGAAIGLMNIMLVSVTERTREIGVRKSIGASAGIIRWQFLTEAIFIGQIGGVIGTIAGILIGNIIAYFIGAEFIIPWNWIILAVVLCLIVSMASGFYPANKAARLDPIESLRYE